jgi:hypothetical protein
VTNQWISSPITFFVGSTSKKIITTVIKSKISWLNCRWAKIFKRNENRLELTVFMSNRLEKVAEERWNEISHFLWNIEKSNLLLRQLYSIKIGFCNLLRLILDVVRNQARAATQMPSLKCDIITFLLKVWYKRLIIFFKWHI